MSNYLIFILFPLILGIFAQGLLKIRYKEASGILAPLSGVMAARAILDSAGLTYVKIERIPGVMTDPYDPTCKTLRLSENSYNGRNLASVAIAAHEAGHALQDAQKYKFMIIRQLAVPLASFGGNTALLFIIVGFAINAMNLAILGVVGFALVAIFQILNLPVEYNASFRARKQLSNLGFISSAQMPIVDRMLKAAALTYVAGTLSAIFNFLYYALLIINNQKKK